MNERIFNNIKITPEELMAYATQQGKILLSDYMKWLMTDRSWKSVKDIIKDKLSAI